MKFKKTAALVGVTALVALAGPAMAVPTLVQIDGNGANVDRPFTAVTKGGISFSSGSVTMGCTSGTANGVIRGGTRGNPIAEIRNTGWVGCVGPLGISMAVDMKPIGSPAPWRVNGYSGETNAITDTIVGDVTNVSARVRSTNPLAPCSFQVNGSADGVFLERVQKSAGPPAVFGQDLVINENSGNLTISNVSGCFGLLNSGATANFAATYNVNVTGAVSQTPVNVMP